MPTLVTETPLATAAAAVNHFEARLALETDCADVRQALAESEDFRALTTSPLVDRNEAVRAVAATKVYGVGDTAVRALDDVTVGFPAGRFTAIMGPSGSGKSTLMNLIGCLDTPTAGEYILNGQAVAGLADDELARHVVIGRQARRLEGHHIPMRPGHERLLLAHRVRLHEFERDADVRIVIADARDKRLGIDAVSGPALVTLGGLMSLRA